MQHSKAVFIRFHPSRFWDVQTQKKPATLHFSPATSKNKTQKKPTNKYHNAAAWFNERKISAVEKSPEIPTKKCQFVFWRSSCIRTKEWRIQCTGLW